MLLFHTAPSQASGVPFRMCCGFWDKFINRTGTFSLCRSTRVLSTSTPLRASVVSVSSGWSTAHLIHSASTLVGTIISEAGGMVMGVVV